MFCHLACSLNGLRLESYGWHKSGYSSGQVLNLERWARNLFFKEKKNLTVQWRIFYKIADIQHNQETAIIRWKQKNKLSVCDFFYFKIFLQRVIFVWLVYFIFIFKSVLLLSSRIEYGKTQPPYFGALVLEKEESIK